MKDQRPYLNDLLTRIQMIQDFTVEGHEDFVQSPKTQESVIRCFEVIGEIIKRLSPDLFVPHPHIPWRQFVGFSSCTLSEPLSKRNRMGNYERLSKVVVSRAAVRGNLRASDFLVFPARSYA